MPLIEPHCAKYYFWHLLTGARRRRLLEILNVLESVQVIHNQGKERYTWIGSRQIAVALVKLKVYTTVQTQVLILLSESYVFVGNGADSRENYLLITLGACAKFPVCCVVNRHDRLFMKYAGCVRKTDNLRNPLFIQIHQNYPQTSMKGLYSPNSWANFEKTWDWGLHLNSGDGGGQITNT